MADHHLRFGYSEVLPDRATDALLPFGANASSSGSPVELPPRKDAGHSDFLFPAARIRRYSVADAVQERHAIPLDRLQDSFGAGAMFHDRGRDAIAQRKKDVVAERADEAPFAGRQHDIARLRRNARTVAVAERFEPAMGVHHPFWSPVVPDVKTMNAGASGRASNGAGGKSDPRSRCPSWDRPVGQQPRARRAKATGDGWFVVTSARRTPIGAGARRCDRARCRRTANSAARVLRRSRRRQGMRRRIQSNWSCARAFCRRVSRFRVCSPAATLRT